MNVMAGKHRLQYAGGRATVEQMAEWCGAPKDPSPAGCGGYSAPGLVAMMAELSAIGVHQVTSAPNSLDAMVKICDPTPISATDGTLAAAMLRAEGIIQ